MARGATVESRRCALTGGFREDYETLFVLHRDVDDDFFYVGSPYWGIPWMEAILGCPVVAGQETAWARPCLSEIGAELETVNLETNPWFECLVDFTSQLLKLAAGRFPVCPPLLRGPGDLVSAMAGGMKFAMGFLDDPARMAALLDHVAGLRLEVVERLQAMIPAWHGTYAAAGIPVRSGRAVP